MVLRAGEGRLLGSPPFFRAAVEDSIVAYAAHSFGLLKRTGPLNLTEGEQLASRAARGDPVAIAKLRAPPFPRRYGYVLDLFDEFSEFRRVDGYGEHPASWQDLHAWCAMTEREPLTAWERHMFRRIENAHFRAKSPPTAAQKTGARA